MIRGVALLAVVTAVACGGGEEPPNYDQNGAIEVILGFKDASGTFTTPDPAELRSTLKQLGLRGITLQRLEYRIDGALHPAARIMVEWTEWPLSPVREQAITAIRALDPDAIQRAQWSGYRIHIRSVKALDEARLRSSLTALDLDVREHRADADEVTGEHSIVLTMGGVDARIERALEARWPGTDVIVAESQMVGPRRRGR